MAGNPSFTKRMKERARQEKRQEKLQRKAQREAEKGAAPPAPREGEPVIEHDEEGRPQGLDFHDF